LLSREGAAYSEFAKRCNPPQAMRLSLLQQGELNMIMPITLTIAGAAAILHVWLSLRVSRLRRPLKVGVGDGGNMILLRRIRAHGNFTENVPLFLILLGLLEFATGGDLWLWGAAILFIIARIAHAFGMDREGANPLRVGGVTINWLVLLGLGIYAIVLAYQAPPVHRAFQTAPVHSAEANADEAAD
jgi:uncharacterized membrane protein YecN with MAPEG domain